MEPPTHVVSTCSVGKYTTQVLPIFVVDSTNKQINEKNWNEFNDSFAESFLLTKPSILIQDKQQIVNRKKVISGYSPSMLDKDLIKKEHNKCKNIGEHIFLFVTDSKQRPIRKMRF
ncbi:hypothetical protein Glove_180g90 [Diversispora epigaea]|uniref:Uncharacterized protein n=1 Tax=Diversispora epigaea TaxID=1348612 RepID=A0A397IXJ7_9GLOM|nr:hypothetical protein Glove_180g90 [Diversispora epigaea]